MEVKTDKRIASGLANFQNSSNANRSIYYISLNVMHWFRPESCKRPAYILRVVSVDGNRQSL